MPGYIEKTLQCFGYKSPANSEDIPHGYAQPMFGAKQYLLPLTNHSLLNNAKKNASRKLLALCYTMHERSTVHTSSSQHHSGTTGICNQEHAKAINKLLDYCALHPSSMIQYYASNMVLWVDSNASYLTAPKARSQAAGFHYLRVKPTSATMGPGKVIPPMNGAVHYVMSEQCTKSCQVLQRQNLAVFFTMEKAAYPMQITLEELGHVQPPTPMQTNNSTATGIANNNIKQQCSKAMDMRFYWVRDCVHQEHFHIYWKPGKYNKADYFTKHHPATHHCDIRTSYIHDAKAKDCNYFECLAESNKNKVSMTTPKSCEGVLMDESRLPICGTGQSNTLDQ